MKTELTEHNIESFFFEQVQQKLLEDKMAKKRKATKRGEAIPSNWRGNCLHGNVKIKYIELSTFLVADLMGLRTQISDIF